MIDLQFCIPIRANLEFGSLRYWQLFSIHVFQYRHSQASHVYVLHAKSPIYFRIWKCIHDIHVVVKYLFAYHTTADRSDVFSTFFFFCTRRFSLLWGYRREYYFDKKGQKESMFKNFQLKTIYKYFSRIRKIVAGAMFSALIFCTPGFHLKFCENMRESIILDKIS